MLINNALTVVLAANGASALAHRHNRRHQYVHDQEKRDIVYVETDIVTEVDWVTVTVDPEVTTSSPPSTSAAPVVVPTPASEPPKAAVEAPSSSSVSTTPTPTPATTAVPTTLVTSTSAPAFVAPNVNVKLSSSSSTEATPTTTAAAATSAAAKSSPATAASGNKRGAAYNTASLISPLVGSGSKLSWAYNWGQVSDGLKGVDSSLEYVPMLWGTRSDFISTWDKNAEAAISSGAKNFLSFNEPDNAGQSNMDAATAAAGHIKYMNPYSGRVRIGSPAISNSNLAGEGISWLKNWVSACNGQCKYDFCAAHWYSPADAKVFLEFTQQVSQACGNKPVWITEFAPTGSNDQIVSFLKEVQDALDNNPTYSNVERYAYFMVSDGRLVSGSSASTIGNTFAYSR